MRATSPSSLTASTREKAAALAAWLDGRKAGEVRAYDLSGENALAEAAVIATASSVRHGQGLAEHLLQLARQNGYEFLRIEGNAAGQWILLDLNDVIVHIFLADVREMFRLEDLWAGAPLIAGDGEKP